MKNKTKKYKTKNSIYIETRRRDIWACADAVGYFIPNNDYWLN